MRARNQRRRSPAALALLAALACSQPGADPQAPAEAEAAAVEWAPRQGAALIGQAAPTWSSEKVWLNSEPLQLEQLRGQVVLLRFWLVGCGYCQRTAPALNALDEEYRARGLRVIGFHHPKSAHARDPEVVRAAVRQHGFRFPIALDDDWEALRSYWLTPVPDYRFTSVSFLIDREGVIRWVHDGGEYHDLPGPAYAEARAAYRSLRATIEQLL